MSQGIGVAEVDVDERAVTDGLEFALHRGGVTLRGDSLGVGPAVVFLHAGRERRSVWTPVIDRLRRASALRCVTLDLRGHGDSDGVADDLAVLGRDVGALVSLVGTPVVLVGCSLGGLASLAALSDPATRQGVGGVVLIDVVPEPEPGPVWQFLDDWGLLPEAATLFDELIDHGPRLAANLSSFGGKVALLRAERSALTAHDCARFYREHGADVVEIEGVSHLIARDDPERLGSELSCLLGAWLPATRARAG
ncbi:MAG: alpha/beta hydrolase [Actinomycetota bacterium]